MHSRLQFAIQLPTPFHVALLVKPQPFLLAACLLAALRFQLLLAPTLLLNALLLTALRLFLLLSARTILLRALLLLLHSLLGLSLLALLTLAVLLLAIARNLLRALPLFLLLPGALVFGLGPALHLDLILALGLVLAPFLPFTLPPTLGIKRG